MKLYGGIEAGGTKFVCAVGTGPDDLRAETSFPTTTPEETLAQAIAFFKGQDDIAAVGIGSFGPLDLRRESPTWGTITSTPKSRWSGADLVGPIASRLGVPVGIDTDVNAAALGEGRWGAARGLTTFVYVTVGTGIGGGGMVEGSLLHGILHPEMGHMHTPHDLELDPFEGSCPYHGDCLEGLASGPAIEARWGASPDSLPPDHPAWELEATYLAHAVVNLICVIAPRRVILGGGVMRQAQLMPLVRAKVVALLNGYLQLPALLDTVDSYIVSPGLGSRSGVLGAIALAEAALIDANGGSGG
jgi:fructokinase